MKPAKTLNEAAVDVVTRMILKIFLSKLELQTAKKWLREAQI